MLLNDVCFPFQHEWNKHGTCINTVKPSCFSRYKSGEDVLAYIKRVVSLYQGLPTYKLLAAHDIFPTTHKNYTLDQIQGALTHATGFNATIVCDVTHHFTEVYYHYNLKGSMIDGKFVPTIPVRRLTQLEVSLYPLTRRSFPSFPV